MSSPVRRILWFERHPQLNLVRLQRESEIARHDPNHSMCFAIERKSFSDHVGVRAESSLPQTVAYDHNPVAPRTFLVGQKGSSESWLDAQQCEKVARNTCPRSPLRNAYAREVESFNHKSRKRLECAVFILPIYKIGQRNTLGRSLRSHFQNSYNLVGLLVGKHTKQDCIHHAEDGCIGTDAQSQGQRRHRRKSWALEQHPKTVAKIIKHSDEWLVASGEFLPQAVQHPLKFFDRRQGFDW